MTANHLYSAFGQAVSIRREQLKMTQAELAAQVRLSRASVANIEAGRQSVLLHHACGFATALGLPTIANLLPSDARYKDDREAFALSDEVSVRSKAQISDLITTALATAKTRP